MKQLGEINSTARGFEVIEFRDRSGNSCQLQQSSAADGEPPASSAVWLGCEPNRMHLNVDQVVELVATLRRWVETGSFKA